jgi:hypothetical protein
VDHGHGESGYFPHRPVLVNGYGHKQPPVPSYGHKHQPVNSYGYGYAQKQPPAGN